MGRLPVCAGVVEERQPWGRGRFFWFTWGMSATERKVTALAVGSWVLPLTLIFAVELVRPDMETSVVSVLIAGAEVIVLFVASALAARHLQRRFWPSWAERYTRARYDQALTVSMPVAFAFVAVTGAIEGEWVQVLLGGAGILFCVYPLVSLLRGHRSERPPPSASPPSAQHP